MSTAEDPRETHEWEVAKKSVLKRDQYRCQGCRKTEADWRGIDLHVHHIRAVKDGGGNGLENLVVLCNRCHNRVHDWGPEGGKYPPSLAERGSGAVLDSRYSWGLEDRDIAALNVLVERGPTQKKDIKGAAGLDDWEINQVVDDLQVTKHIARVSRGVYAYVTEGEYDRVIEKHDRVGDSEDVYIHAYDPSDELEDDGVNSNEFMGDRTSISVEKETKELLEEHRDGQKWDAFLRSLVEGSCVEQVQIDPSQAEEIARMSGERAADELEARMR